jgi:hypothetical protein
VYIVSYFFGSIVEILIIIDRIGLFQAGFKKNIIKLSAYETCLVSLALTLILNIPYYLETVVNSNTFRLNATHSFTVWKFEESPFSQTRPGVIVSLICDIIRDLLVAAIQIVLNFIFILSFKRHIDKKNRLVSIVEPQQETATSSLEIARRTRISVAELKATTMCIIVCMLSIIEHLSVLSTVLITYFTTNDTIISVAFSIAFQWLLHKRILEFFVFVFFNKKFKKIFMNYLGF